MTPFLSAAGGELQVRMKPTVVIPLTESDVGGLDGAVRVGIILIGTSYAEALTILGHFYCDWRSEGTKRHCFSSYGEAVGVKWMQWLNQCICVIFDSLLPHSISLVISDIDNVCLDHTINFFISRRSPFQLYYCWTCYKYKEIPRRCCWSYGR